MRNSKTDVIIIGAGIIGLCSAYYLSRAGLKVKILEASPGLEGCSHGNAGHICQSHIIPLANPEVLKKSFLWLLNQESPFYIKPRIDKDLFAWGRKFLASAFSNDFEKKVSTLAMLGKKSLSNYQEIFKKIEFQEIKKGGILTVCNTDEGLNTEKIISESARKFGIESTVLKSEGVQALENELDLNVKGGVLYPDDFSVDPALLIRYLQNWLLKNNVDFVFDCSVNAFSSESHKVKTAKTIKGDFSADRFIIATGAWAPKLWNPFGSRIYMQGAKGYSMEIPNPGTIKSASIIFSERKVVITPMGKNLRLAGTLELSGFDEKIRKKRVEGIFKALKEFAPNLYSDRYKETEVWYGYRPTTPDGLPFIGRHPRIKNLFINAGHAMLGLAFAGVSGEIISNNVLGQDPNMDLSSLSPNRF